MVAVGMRSQPDMSQATSEAAVLQAARLLQHSHGLRKDSRQNAQGTEKDSKVAIEGLLDKAKHSDNSVVPWIKLAYSRRSSFPGFLLHRKCAFLLRAL